jgi:uncharacterized protein YuzE
METILRRVAMQCEYDPDTDKAHIHIADPGASSTATRTFACDAHDIGAQILLDFDLDGRLLLIQILDASRKLPDTFFRALDS